MDSFTAHFAPAKEHRPTKMILPTEDLLMDFFKAIGGEILPKQDVEEILTQIVCVLLNSDENTEVKLQSLPDFNRIVSTQLFASIKPAVPELALAIRNRLVEYGAYKDADFPYFFDGLLGRDVLLSYLPY
jgi:hypothetical protein